MERLSSISHNGKKIIYADFSYLKISDKEEIIKLFDDTNARVYSLGYESARLISNFTNTEYDSTIFNHMLKYAKNNTPYIKSSALIGMNSKQIIVLAIVKSVTGRQFQICKDLEEAKILVSKE